MDKNNIVHSILIHLGFFEGDSSVTTIRNAAKKALNDDAFEFGKYNGVHLKSILGSLNGKNIIQYQKAQKTNLSHSFFELYDKKPDGLDLQVQHLREALSNSSANDESLLWALECHGASLSISTEHNTVSLFDFVKLTAAFAYCLIESDNVRIVSANISGIQSYLYEIVSKNASKLLKGRSFYLQILGDSILNDFLEKFNVKSYCTIYTSGGGFYILVPDYMNIDSIFESVTNEIAKKVYALHKTNLFVETSISGAFDGVTGLNDIWDGVFSSLKKRRNNRLSWNEALRKDFWGFVEDGGDTKRDPITNEEIPEGQDDGRLFGVSMQKITKQQIELGKQLRDANFWYRSREPRGDNYLKDPLGVYHKFESRETKFDSLSVMTFNDFDSQVKTLLYGGNRIPLFGLEDRKMMEEANRKLKPGEGEPYDFGDVKPFDMLAKGESLGRLAILRMDVDGLGTIFSKGFHNMCMYATVSRSLDMFFKGFLNTLWSKYENTTQIIYSGGDDLFVVGKWNDVFSFAHDIHDAFKNWSCGGVLSLSGGIVLLPSKFPVMQGAKMADRAEKAAKKHEYEDKKKNSICFLDMPLNWDEELPLVIELKNKFSDLLHKGLISKGLFSKISTYAEARKAYQKSLEEYNNGIKKNRPNPSWIWTMLYDFSRYKEQQTKGAEAKEFVSKLIVSITSNSYNNSKYHENRHILDILHLAVRWADLEKRTQDDNI